MKKFPNPSALTFGAMAIHSLVIGLVILALSITVGATPPGLNVTDVLESSPLFLSYSDAQTLCLLDEACTEFYGLVSATNFARAMKLHAGANTLTGVNLTILYEEIIAPYSTWSEVLQVLWLYSVSIEAARDNERCEHNQVLTFSDEGVRLCHCKPSKKCDNPPLMSTTWDWMFKVFAFTMIWYNCFILVTRIADGWFAPSRRRVSSAQASADTTAPVEYNLNEKKTG